MMLERTSPASSQDMLMSIETNRTESRVDHGNSDNDSLQSSLHLSAAHHSRIRRKALPIQTQRATSGEPSSPEQYFPVNISNVEDGDNNDLKKTQAPRHRLAASLILWKWELLSLVGSAASLVAIILTLHAYQDRTLSSWKLPISINAVVAILSATFKASLGLPISEGMIT